MADPLEPFKPLFFAQTFEQGFNKMPLVRLFKTAYMPRETRHPLSETGSHINPPLLYAPQSPGGFSLHCIKKHRNRSIRNQKHNALNH